MANVEERPVGGGGEQGQVRPKLGSQARNTVNKQVRFGVPVERGPKSGCGTPSGPKG